MNLIPCILFLLCVFAFFWALNKLYDWYFAKRYGAHVIRFHDGTYGVRRRWLDKGFEFLGAWPSDGTTWWYSGADYERVSRFATPQEAKDFMAVHEAEEAARKALRKREGGKRV